MLLRVLTALAVLLSMTLPLAAENFGRTADGIPVDIFTLKNKNGLTARVMTRGATLVSLQVPDKSGKLSDIVLGFDDVAGYESDRNQYFGCTTGRVCNRIAKGKFTLSGKEYSLAINNPPNHLHGGVKRSFDKVVWKAATDPKNQAVAFQYTADVGEEGYPGRVTVVVTYTLTDENELRLDYVAKAESETPLNVTNHTYFNLGGEGSETVLDHELLLKADKYTPNDATLIPTGKIEPVSGTPLDFTKSTRIGERIGKLDSTPNIGYDHNFVLNNQDGKLAEAAQLHDPKSGRLMTVKTTEPGVQVYSGNFLKGQKGKGGKVYRHRSALCLETQHYPDSVNRPEFPSIILKAGQEYKSTTVYAFSTK